MKILVALSGGVDSSVAAAMLLDEGHEVTGVTMKLWGGPSDSGCCSVADVEDARRVAQQLGIDHWVFNFSEQFERDVVAPYATDHTLGLTPNPCIECNRHLKFDPLLRRAGQLGFDAIATGHHARVGLGADGWYLRRGADAAKDQSYVLYVLTAAQLARCRFPVGHVTKDDVRARAGALGLRTAAKPDSQDVCFVTASAGRRAFLESRIPLHPGRVVDASGQAVGSVDAVELVTVGQRRGLGSPAGRRQYAVRVDPSSATVVVGDLQDLQADQVALRRMTWVNHAVGVGERLMAQTSAHGRAVPAEIERSNGDGVTLRFDEPVRRTAPGQSVVLYERDEVRGGGIAV